jgi:N-ethylmaleimide reductase
MSDSAAPRLLNPITLGALTLPNRVIMAPMTRLRSDLAFTPTELVAQYYMQRAGAGMIVSESVSVSPFGEGFPNIPGIFTDAQEAAWERVASGVHRQGGLMVAQIMHVGKPRFADPNEPEKQPGWAVMEPLHPHELDAGDLACVVNGYREGARRSRAAGFDGVEFYNCNGFIMDRFLRSASNRRTDGYGGSVENRVRLTLESLDAVLSIWPANRVGIRISPSTTIGGAEDPDAMETFTFLIDRLNERGLAYVHMTRVTQQDWARGSGGDVDIRALRKRFSGGTILAGDFDFAGAEQALEDDAADAIAFARLFLANPDLPARFARGAPLNEPKLDTFYSPGPEGYIDYEPCDVEENAV